VYDSSEGALAREADNRPRSVTVAADGTIFYADLDSLSSMLVRRVAPDGRVYTVAGNRSEDVGFDPNGAARGNLPYAFNYDLALDQSGRLLVGMGDQAYLLRVQAPVGVASATETVIPRPGELLIFSGTGKHLRTVDSTTGAVVRTFGYDGAGRLVTVDDAFGLRTTIERDGSGRITAFVASGGQRSPVLTNADGFVTRLTDAGGHATAFTYAADGLLATMTSPGGGVHSFTYDSSGRLISDVDPSGAAQQLGRVRDATGWTVTLRSPLGHDTTYRYEPLEGNGIRRVRTDPSGARTTIVANGVDSISTTFPDGTTAIETFGPDPRFGSAVPTLVQRTRETPAGKTEALTVVRTAQLNQPGNLLDVKNLTTTETVNGRVRRSEYDGATRRVTETSAEGRVHVTGLSAQGRVVREEAGAGLAPTITSYDASGRPLTMVQGVRSITYEWDVLNRLLSVTDGLGHKERYEYDAADQITAVISPSGARTQYTYDADGYRTSTTRPSGAVIGESVDARGLPVGVDPPGAGAFTTSRAADGRINTRTLPGGRAVSLTYDAKGRLTGSTDDNAGSTAITYDAAVQERVTSQSRTIGADTQATAYGYDGGLITSMAMTGPAAGSYAYTYGDDFRRTGATLTVGATSIPLPLEVDKDGALSKDGAMTVQRGTFAAAPTRIGDATGVTSYTYDAQGRVTKMEVVVGGVVKWQSNLSWDAADRLTKEVETVGGVGTRTDYVYGTDGQLTQVSKNLAVAETYTWDADGKRTSNAATYDAADALTSLGGTARTNTADGSLATRGGDSFSYGPNGELLSATVAGVTVTYGYDARNRRTSRTQGGQTTGYLYGDLAHPDRISAIVEPGSVVTVLTYDDFGRLVTFARGATRFYVGTDQVGTPRLILNASGDVVERRLLSAFGVPGATTGPGANLPIGFAGGLADPVTGLVRFGTRDYDPAAGRFTTPDPILLASGSADLYEWVGGDPVSLRDVDGRDGFWSEVGDYLFGKAVDAGTDAATDAAGEIVGKENVENAEKVKSVVEDVKEGKNPLADEYKDQVDRSKEQSTENASSIFDPIKNLWTAAANAICPGDSEETKTGDKTKGDKKGPPKKNTIKVFGTDQSVSIPSVNTSSYQADY
jgi:RHS repeat-associated protein